MSQVSSVPVEMGDATEFFAPRLRVLGHPRLRKMAAAIEEAAARVERPEANSEAKRPDATPACVILLDEPAFAAAWALQRGVASGIQAALGQWLEFARTSVRMWQEAPSRVLLLDGFGHDTSELLGTMRRWDATFEGLPLTHEAERLVEPTLLGLARRACRNTIEVEEVLADLAAAGLRFETVADPVTAPHDPEQGVALVGRESADDGRELEAARLRKCLDDTQRELEAVYVKLLQASDELNARSLTGGATPVRASYVRVWACADGADATSLQVDLRELVIGQMPVLPRLRMELHLVGGDPELHLFGTGADREVLSAWQCDGTSAGRPFMRLRPSGEEGRRRLQLLGAADWQAVVALTALLQKEVERLRDEAPFAWRLSAARLGRQMAAIPARFRYDALDVTAGGPASDVLHLCFRGASFGRLALQDVRLRWGAACLDWLLNAGATELPLTAWPVDAAGVPAPSWTVPVGRGLGARAHAPAWLALLDEDRDLVLAVLDALPASAVVSSDELAGRHGGREAMSASASTLLRQAHASLRLGRTQARLRRVRGLGWLLR